jgi:hypothetical protein
MADWDVPSDVNPVNRGTIFTYGYYDELLVQGSDTIGGSSSCQDDSSRYGVLGHIERYSADEYRDDPCWNTMDFHGNFCRDADSLLLADDSLFAHDFWSEVSMYGGTTIVDSVGDLASVQTLEHDFTLWAADTLTFYFVLAATQQGDMWDAYEKLENGWAYYDTWLRDECGWCYTCCIGYAGNVDGDPAGLVDIGDLTALIAYLYVPPNPTPACMESANVDDSPDGVVDIGDLTALIMYLYIPPNPKPRICCVVAGMGIDW